MGTSEAKDAGTPTCNIALCGKEAEWRVEMFERVEYYCERHRPGVPEKFLTAVKSS